MEGVSLFVKSSSRRLGRVGVDFGCQTGVKYLDFFGSFRGVWLFASRRAFGGARGHPKRPQGDSKLLRKGFVWPPKGLSEGGKGAPDGVRGVVGALLAVFSEMTHPPYENLDFGLREGP